MDNPDAEVEVHYMLKQVDADALESICGTLSIDVLPAKKGNKVFLQKLIMRYLISEDMEEEEDGGASKIQAVTDNLKVFLKIPLGNTNSDSNVHDSQKFSGLVSK